MHRLVHARLVIEIMSISMDIVYLPLLLISYANIHGYSMATNVIYLDARSNMITDAHNVNHHTSYYPMVHAAVELSKDV